VTELLDRLADIRATGRKILVPYVMGGIPEKVAFPETLQALAEHSDLVEIGLPYSDPLMDGPVIAAAGERVIRQGIGPIDALGLAAGEDAGDKVVMTYYNPVHRLGEAEFCRAAVRAGFRGLIIPDVPLEESAGMRLAAAAEGLAWIPLVAPTSPPDRVEAITATATGFVYAVSTLGVTGARESLSARAARVVEACRAATDLPVLIGIGVSDARQAREAAREADGVVIGTAVVSLVLERGPEQAGAFLAEVREALDTL
jgi:tryptophan synthase alpha chain